MVHKGRSLYAGSRIDAVEYFCDTLNYRFTKNMEPVDFLFDIANGTERPSTSRHALSAQQLLEFFSKSIYYRAPVVMNGTACKFTMLPIDRVPYYGYLQSTAALWQIGNSVRKSSIILQRAFLVKLKEYEVIKKLFKSNVGLGLFLGYFMKGQGSYGDYCLSLLGIPYSETNNLTALLYLTVAVLFLQQVINVHIICQKIQVFRYERNCNATSVVGFFLSSFLSEIPFIVFFALIFINIVYNFADLNSGVQNYWFFVGVELLVAILGYTTALMAAAVIRREIVVRDLFIFFFLMMTFCSGYIFPLPTMTQDVRDISVVNPFRWVFEALMFWKFHDYKDGPAYLKKYTFYTFEKQKIFGILFNFIIFSVVLFFIAILPLPNTLRRKRMLESFDALDENDDKSKDRVSLVTPTIFMRESSFTGITRLSSKNSIHSNDDNKDITRGPVVSFRNLSYRVTDPTSPMGYKNILQNVTGR